MINKYGVEEWNELELNYNICSSELISTKNALNNAQKQILNLKTKVIIQKEKIKSLSNQINLLNRAIWRYKNGKN